MHSARNLIVSISTLFAVALVLSVIDLRQDPDSGGVGRDSFGLRAHGYRGVFEVLGELGIDAQRKIAPPSAELPTDITVALLEPSPLFVATEPAYLEKLVDWVEAGGRLVVAPPTNATRRRYRYFYRDEGGPIADRSILDVLGLSQVRVLGDTTENNSPSDSDSENWWREGLRDLRAQQPTATYEFLTGPDGEVELTLALPPGPLLTIDSGNLDGRPVLQRDGADAEADIVAQAFPRGAGEIVVVADPDLFANALVRQEDNSVAAVALLSPEGGPIVFDEHYHGLTVRGNPLYLLTRRGFAVVTVGLLAASAIWAWRTSVALGPPVVTPAKARRDLREYVEAMARLLLRTRDGRRYLLQEFRQGTLEELGKQLGLSALTPKPEQVAAALSRRDRQRAEAFTTTIDAIDRRLDQRGRLGVAETTDLMQRASSCL